MAQIEEKWNSQGQDPLTPDEASQKKRKTAREQTLKILKSEKKHGVAGM